MKHKITISLLSLLICLLINDPYIAPTIFALTICYLIYDEDYWKEVFYLKYRCTYVTFYAIDGSHYKHPLCGSAQIRKYNIGEDIPTFISDGVEYLMLSRIEIEVEVIKNVI